MKIITVNNSSSSSNSNNSISIWLKREMILECMKILINLIILQLIINITTKQIKATTKNNNKSTIVIKTKMYSPPPSQFKMNK